MEAGRRVEIAVATKKPLVSLSGFSHVAKFRTAEAGCEKWLMTALLCSKHAPNIYPSVHDLSPTVLDVTIDLQTRDRKSTQSVSFLTRLCEFSGQGAAGEFVVRVLAKSKWPTF